MGTPATAGIGAGSVELEAVAGLSRGVYASNAQLVEKARTIIEAMGARVVTAAEARERLKLH